MTRQRPQGYPVGLVGESHYQPAIARCRIGEPVEVTPQPENAFDCRAIVVRSPRGEPIGYIPKAGFGQRIVHEEGGRIRAQILSINRTPNGPAGVVIDVTLE